jgi:hypothetical protein
VGGLVGTNASANGRTALIIDSYASGNAVGRDDQDAVGGLVGMNTGVIERSASSGSAYGRGILGSLVGWNLHPDAYRTESEIRQSQGSGTVNGDDGRQVGLDQGTFEW